MCEFGRSENIGLFDFKKRTCWWWYWDSCFVNTYTNYTN